MTGADVRTPPGLRLSASASLLVGLPWERPLAGWTPADAALVEVPLGASQHVVRVIQAGGRLWTLKELPRRAAEREHTALVAMQRRGVPAVRPAGLVTRQSDGAGVLVTAYLEHSVPWRTLLSNLPDGGGQHWPQVTEATAVFLVELHRRGVFWGDCSLSNLLFLRDGPVLQPVLVDAETADVRPALTDGQRRHDLEILHDNVAGGLLDLAAEQQRVVDTDLVAAQVRRIVVRYAELWRELHTAPTLAFARRGDAVARISRLNELGYAVDEVRLTSSATDGDEVRLQAVVADRRHHAAALERATGLQVGEGQARVLLDDLRRHTRARPGTPAPEAARSWVEHVLHPAVGRLRRALPGPRDVVQDYCDLLEVRWLLSEQAGRDVGDEAALRVLATGAVPAGAAAELGAAHGRRLTQEHPLTA